jgi:hypothetical protein
MLLLHPKKVKTNKVLRGAMTAKCDTTRDNIRIFIWTHQRSHFIQLARKLLFSLVPHKNCLCFQAHHRKTVMIHLMHRQASNWHNIFFIFSNWIFYAMSARQHANKKHRRVLESISININLEALLVAKCTLSRESRALMDFKWHSRSTSNAIEALKPLHNNVLRNTLPFFPQWDIRNLS